MPYILPLLYDNYVNQQLFFVAGNYSGIVMAEKLLDEIVTPRF